MTKFMYVGGYRRSGSELLESLITGPRRERSNSYQIIQRTALRSDDKISARGAVKMRVAPPRECMDPGDFCTKAS